MKEVIYLVVDEAGVRRMTKNLPALNKYELPLKLEIEVTPEAFRSPTLTRKVVVTDWRQGIDVPQLDAKELFITEEEAENLRRQRIKRLAQTLEAEGYTVIKPNEKEKVGE
jgi:EAL domain-containing protein (putative c-di-GMP-specific phosphodiesterase class I)